jgi:hypothetical protein
LARFFCLISTGDGQFMTTDSIFHSLAQA